MNQQFEEWIEIQKQGRVTDFADIFMMGTVQGRITALEDVLRRIEEGKEEVG